MSHRPKLTGRMPSVCMTCGDTYAFKPCLPEQDGLPSHGYCAPCFEKEKARMEAFFARPSFPSFDHEIPSAIPHTGGA